LTKDRKAAEYVALYAHFSFQCESASCFVSFFSHFVATYFRFISSHVACSMRLLISRNNSP
jgi:hypothetical protein